MAYSKLLKIYALRAKLVCQPTTQAGRNLTLRYLMCRPNEQI